MILWYNNTIKYAKLQKKKVLDSDVLKMYTQMFHVLNTFTSNLWDL